MSAKPRLARLIIGAVILVLLTFLFGLLGPTGFSTRWHNIKDGMTQAEVRKALGAPTSTGTSGTIGAGNKSVTRWEYKHGVATYYVDFDYIGPNGAPLVFRTNDLSEIGNRCGIGCGDAGGYVTS